MHTEAINFRLEFHVDLGLQQLIWTTRFPSVLYSVVFRTALCNSSRAKKLQRFTLLYFFHSSYYFYALREQRCLILYTTGVCFPNSLRSTQNPLLGLAFDCRKQQKTQTLPSKSHCIARRPFQDTCQLFFVPGFLLTGDHFCVSYNYWLNAELHDNIICY